VLVSDAVRAVVTASDISFVEAGCRDLKGIPGPVPVFTAVPATGG
jgi:class 3 adenylate cyclase